MNEQQRLQLEEKIAGLESVAGAPVILQQLLQMLSQKEDDIRLEKVGEAISRDAAIAAQCLRMANSPLFGTRPVETVNGALMLLGINKLRSLLFGLCMHRSVPADKWVLDPISFWRHSLGCALVSQKIACLIGYPDPEKVYLAGLLHDIGFLVNSILYTAKFRECLGHAIEKKCPLHVAENSVLGFSHEDSGRLLCKRWAISEDLVEAAGCHHRLEALPSAEALVCLVHLSDLLCRVRNLGYGYEEILAVSFARHPAWQSLATHYPALSEVDLVTFTLDLEASTQEIAAFVDSVFAVPQRPATRKN